MHIVLVHGAGGTSATWSTVTPVLDARGHRYTLINNPLTSLADDVAHVTSVVDAIDGPVLLVGHSYGGAVITNVGTHDRVVGLVYIAAFAPAERESVSQIVERYDDAEISKYMKRGPNGEWSTDHGDEFWAEINWDVSSELRELMDSEGSGRESADAIFSQETGVPAWASRPSWYLVASGDKTLRPDAQRDMAATAGAITSEINTSHATPKVAPERVADLIDTALAAVS
ncbi:MAG: hypothetical protein JWQ43_3395 [Glaciihabitans sp.]|nr:hypothetical protein [Glaciihabitans sp.]